MHRSSILLLGLLASGIATAQTSAKLLLIDSTADKVMHLDPLDGTLINTDFIVDQNSTATFDFSTPKGVIWTGAEIWVSDQLTDLIARFRPNGTFIGRIGGNALSGMDNMRGLGRIGNEVWASNSGTQNTAPGRALVRFSLTGQRIGFFGTGAVDPFDVTPFNGEALVTDIAGDDLVRFSTGGINLGLFHSSDGASGIDFPQQVIVGPGGKVAAAGFTAPAGLYVYDSSGTQIAYVASQADRGVAFLGNGSIVGTTGTGANSINTITGTSTPLLSGFSGQYAMQIPATQSLTGQIQLQGAVAGTTATRTITLTLRQGTEILGATTYNVGEPVNFDFPVEASRTGAMTLEFDGEVHLRRKLNFTFAGSNIALGNVQLLTGDVDGNGEVDLTDIDAIIAAYLSSGDLPQDLNLDGEVDLTDIDLAIGNYLASDE